jgi:predicted transcriptional regulator
MSEQSIVDFSTMFNRLHKAICRGLGRRDHFPFSDAVWEYKDKHQFWPYRDSLLAIGRLRNVFVHEHVDSKLYLAIPTESSLHTLRMALASVEKPPLVTPRFECPVVCVGSDELLTDVLRRVQSLNFSQFPVYDKGEFKGLLTENGIVRYLARRHSSQETLIELTDVSVRALLREEENNKNFIFVGLTERLDSMLDRFARQPLLEAVLITKSGKKTDKLIGIATQWDAIEARRELEPQSS